ncbi:hypothetical protein M404DRAFT_29168 [Pisolithus tinctorius Marx 270]|uniref:Uncharacterized protein n=1 Tax=Pisolithus tinctorius Marx 270 TaxID=870435 RepID=A0A0C3P0U3_PISTI|nr:hypothetical protein M404DRAFT_29168 [Pisolithus tinctorius Marx 270]
MSSQCQSKTPQPTPGHVRDYSQVADEELVVLTDDSTDTEWEKAKHEEAKRQKAEEERLEVERRKRAEEEEEVRRKKVAEEEAERQRQRASEERAQARREEAAQRLCSAVYDINTAQRVPGTSVVVTCEPGQGKTRACLPCHKKKKVCSWTREDAVVGPSRKRAGTGSSRGEKKKKLRGKGKERVMETEEADNEREVGRDEDKPVTPLEGPSGVGVHMQWAEWEQEQQLQAMERQAKVLAFKRMAEAVEWMAEAAERTADEWALYHAWVEGWKRPQSEAVEDQQEEADEGVEGDNEEEVEGEQEGGEEQEGGREQVMEE